MGWGHMGGWGWGWLLFVVLVIAVVALAVALTRSFTGREQPPGPPSAQRSRALEVLDERYARGEIDGAEYDERRRRIEGYPGR